MPSQSKMMARADIGCRFTGADYRNKRGILPKPGKQRKRIVTVEIDVIERGGETIPSRHLATIHTNHVSSGLQTDAASAKRTFDQSHLEFYRRSRLDIARGEEINAARTDVFCYQSDRRRLRPTFDARQLQGQAQRGARAASAVFGDAYRMRRNPQERPPVQSRQDLANLSSWSCSRSGRKLQFRKCPHVNAPKAQPSPGRVRNMHRYDIPGQPCQEKKCPVIQQRPGSRRKAGKWHSERQNLTARIG